MCLIIYKESSADLNSRLINSAFQRNKDGIGLILWDSEGKPYTEKYLGKKQCLALLKKLPEKLKGIPAIIHFRFATKGVVDVENVHPFKIDDETFLMHNGTLSNYPELDKDRSDTWLFTEYVAKPILLAPMEQKSKISTLEKLSEGSRLLIVQKDLVTMTGTGWHEPEAGIYLSNKSMYDTDYLNPLPKIKKLDSYKPAQAQKSFDWGNDSPYYTPKQRYNRGSTYGDSYTYKGWSNWLPDTDLNIKPSDIMCFEDLMEYMNQSDKGKEKLVTWLAYSPAPRLVDIFGQIYDAIAEYDLADIDQAGEICGTC